MPLTFTLVVFQEFRYVARVLACQQKVPAPSKVNGAVMVEVTGLQAPLPGVGVIVRVAVGPVVDVRVGVLVMPTVGVRVGVLVMPMVGVRVGVLVIPAVGVRVGVAVGPTAPEVPTNVVTLLAARDIPVRETSESCARLRVESVT